MMKKRNLLFLIVLLVIAIIPSFAQTQTQCINYQAVVRDSANRLIINKMIVVQISLTDSFGVTVYYQEEHQTTTNSQGLVTLKIGCGSTTKGDFFSVPWNNAKMYAEYDIDKDGVYDLLSVETIAVVPYALYAENVIPLQNSLDTIIQNINTITTDISNYLTFSELCDSISNCEVIKTLQDSARMFLTSDSIHILVRNNVTDFLTSDSIQRLVRDSVSNFLTSDSIQRLVRDSIFNFLTSDSIQHLVSDSLTNYLRLYELCGKIEACSVITELKNSVQNNTYSIIHDSVNFAEGIAFLGDSLRMLRDSLHVLRDSLEQLKGDMIHGEESIEYVVVNCMAEYPLENHKEPKMAMSIKVYVNGVRIRGAAWTYNQQNQSFIYDPAQNDNYELAVGDKIVIEYWY